MQADLRRLAHRADEQQHADDLERGEGATKNRIGVDLVLCDSGEDRAELDRAEFQEDQCDAHHEGEITNAVDDERLDRRGVGGRTVIPVPDQQVGAEPDAFPAEEQLQQVVRRHQHQHGEGEQ